MKHHAPPRDVCARCGKQPRVRLYLAAERRYVHAGTMSSRARGAMSVCGGEIVHPTDLWRARLRPGLVVRAYTVNASVGSHLVRLGRRISLKSGSWTATALCGEVPHAAGLWVPADPNILSSEACGPCESANQRRNTTELRDEKRALSIQIHKT